MYICNLKINIKKIIIICCIIAIAVALIIELNSMNKATKSNAFDYVLDENNFTTILKSVHNNIEANVGKTVKLSGYIFTLPDFKEDYFVCGRNMELDGDEKVVGFLCSYPDIKNFAESEWVEITGKITKGYYTTDMPVIQVATINKISAPTNTFVKAPN